MDNLLNEIKDCIVKDAQEKAILFGLLKPNLKSVIYSQINLDVFVITVEKKGISNGLFRLDIIRINETPIGTIISSEITHGLYHMIGMFVARPYRSDMINQTCPGYTKACEANNLGTISPAVYLLKSYIDDIVKGMNYQVTLEVTNNNEPAWHLYEKHLLLDSENGQKRGFELLTKEDILLYAKVRRKKISKWYRVVTTNGDEGVGVQWDHIPDYGGNPERWSTNRVYLIKPLTQNFLLLDRKVSFLGEKLKVIFAICKFGSLIHYINEKIRSILKSKLT